MHALIHHSLDPIHSPLPPLIRIFVAGSIISISKSGLRRVRNCMGELALRFETVGSFCMCQPNHSYAVFMFSLHSDPTRAIVVAGVLY